MKFPLVIELAPFRKYRLGVSHLQEPVWFGFIYLFAFLIHADILFHNSFKKWYENNSFASQPSISLSRSTNSWKHGAFNKMEGLLFFIQA